jgi:hypothetical protein
MDRRPYSYKSTAEDCLIIQKWKSRLTIVYGAILLMLIVVLVSSNHNRIDRAISPVEHGFSSASVASDQPAH